RGPDYLEASALLRKLRRRYHPRFFLSTRARLGFTGRASFTPRLFLQSEQRVDHLRAADPHLAPVKHRDFRQDAGARPGQGDENLSTIRRPLGSANELKFLEFVDQTDRGMVFY